MKSFFIVVVLMLRNGGAQIRIGGAPRAKESHNHKHIRPMYTEYNLLPYNTRKYILEQCNSEGLIDVDNFHVGKSIKLLCDDLENFSLSSRRLLYVFTQYFPRNFINYANCSVEQYDLCSFERLCKPDALKSIVGDCSTLDEYIDDYLWLRENGIQPEALPPMDYLWNQKDLGACREEILVFWLYRFIVDVCNNLFIGLIQKDFGIFILMISAPKDKNIFIILLLMRCTIIINAI